MKLTPVTQRPLVRTGNVALGVWLFIVLFAYAGVLKLPALLADAAALTMLIVIANMIWRYAVQPLLGARRQRT